jgi:hypothetical protein
VFALYLTRELSDAEFKADVIHNTGRFLMMESSQRFNPALSQSRNGTVAHSSG